MSKQTEALRLALEALEETLRTLDDENAKPGGAIADTIWYSAHETLFDYLGAQIATIREALAEQPAQQSKLSFWLEPQPDDLELAAEQSDNYAAFHAGYRFAVAHSLTEQPAPVAPPHKQQEPVEYWTVADGWVSEQAEVPAAAWIYPEFWDHCKMVGCGTAYRLPGDGRQPLYTSPHPSKPWVGLTDEDVTWLCNTAKSHEQTWGMFVRAVEAKLREKNA